MKVEMDEADSRGQPAQRRRRYGAAREIALGEKGIHGVFQETAAGTAVPS